MVFALDEFRDSSLHIELHRNKKHLLCKCNKGLECLWNRGGEASIGLVRGENIARAAWLEGEKVVPGQLLPWGQEIQNSVKMLKCKRMNCKMLTLQGLVELKYFLKRLSHKKDGNLKVEISMWRSDYGCFLTRWEGRCTSGKLWRLERHWINLSEYHQYHTSVNLTNFTTLISFHQLTTHQDCLTSPNSTAGVRSLGVKTMQAYASYASMSLSSMYVSLIYICMCFSSVYVFLICVSVSHLCMSA